MENTRQYVSAAALSELLQSFTCIFSPGRVTAIARNNALRYRTCVNASPRIGRLFQRAFSRKFLAFGALGNVLPVTRDRSPSSFTATAAESSRLLILYGGAQRGARVAETFMRKGCVAFLRTHNFLIEGISLSRRFALTSSLPLGSSDLPDRINAHDDWQSVRAGFPFSKLRQRFAEERLVTACKITSLFFSLPLPLARSRSRSLLLF